MLSRDRRAPSRYPQKGEINAHGVLTLLCLAVVGCVSWRRPFIYVSRHNIGVAHPYKKELRFNGLACRTKRDYPS